MPRWTTPRPLRRPWCAVILTRSPRASIQVREGRQEQTLLAKHALDSGTLVDCSSAPNSQWWLVGVAVDLLLRRCACRSCLAAMHKACSESQLFFSTRTSSIIMLAFAASSSSSSSSSSSGLKRRHDAAGASAEEAPSRRIRPLSFQRGPNPTLAARIEAGDTYAAHPSARLYSHALDSIFSFLTLRDLSGPLGVSHTWAAAVGSMRCIRAEAPNPHSPPRTSFLDISASASARHISSLKHLHLHECNRAPFSSQSLYILSRRMVNLESLSCDLELERPFDRLHFPRKIKTMHLRLVGAAPNAAANHVIEAVGSEGAMPALQILRLEFDQPIGPALRFAPLVNVKQLRKLEMRTEWSDEPLSDQQVADLRSLSQLHELALNVIDDAQLARLLHPPHSLQWRTLTVSRLSDAGVELVLSLPSLTELLTHQEGETQCSNLASLNRLPHLQRLSLTMPPRNTPAAENLLTGLQSCARLTRLTMRRCSFTCDQLDALLPCLPNLSSLALSWMQQLTSLQCFAVGPVTRTLKELTLKGCMHPGLPLTELRHLHALKSLEHLELSHVFVEEMGSHLESLYTPPSLLIPTLRVLWYQAEAFDFNPLQQEPELD